MKSFSEQAAVLQDARAGFGRAFWAALRPALQRFADAVSRCLP